MKILIAEDDPVFRCVLQSMLADWGYQAHAAANGVEAWDILQAEPGPSLVILDWLMPGMDGLELCRRLRSLAGSGPHYVILLSARSSTADVVAGLEGGADDYVAKPVDFQELRARLQVGLRMIELQVRLATHVRELEEALNHVRELQEETEKGREREHFLAMHDALTGLPNRALFFDRLEQALVRARRDKEKVAVLFLDLDGFKAVNDTLGHGAGDSVLQAVTQRIDQGLRASDTFARLGGDEFALILGGLERPQEAVAVARKLLKLLTPPIPLEKHRLFVAASIGISIYPSDGEDVEELVKKADFAMYGAKRDGKNNVKLYAGLPHVSRKAAVSLENDLRGALRQNELFLHYQPQVSLVTGALTGFEALLRWQHPQVGTIAPERFIPWAEESGLIIPIGEWVLHTACTQGVIWQRIHCLGLRTAVNLSARQFRDKNLPRMVARILQETSLSPQCLELEITESLAMQDLDCTIATMRRLKQMGVKLSVDDFGTGHSTLTCLKRFPVDMLKIDRSFVRGIPSDRDNTFITMAIIGLAHNLEIGVIAEGVENEAERVLLNSLQCDEMQGFLVSAPLPEESLTEFFELTGDRNPVGEQP
jgi:diguanylate cyclase (GGDEF)-like protein